MSPGPSVDHNGMVRDIERGLFAAELTDPTFVWRSVQTTELNMFEIGDGYIPDLIVMDAEVLAEARATKAKHLLPYQVDLVIEVTSRSNAVSDRRPDQKRKAGTKWSGYAHAGIPIIYLLTVIQRYVASRCTRVRTRELELMSRCKRGALVKPSACRIRSASRFQRSTGTMGQLGC